jgi:hypothetical protein
MAPVCCNAQFGQAIRESVFGGFTQSVLQAADLMGFKDSLRINETILPGDHIGFGHRSNVIVSEMLDELLDNFSNPHRVLSATFRSRAQSAISVKNL